MLSSIYLIDYTQTNSEMMMIIAGIVVWFFLIALVLRFFAVAKENRRKDKEYTIYQKKLLDLQKAWRREKDE